MAKAPKNKETAPPAGPAVIPGVDHEFLKRVYLATVTGGFEYVTQEVGAPLLAANLIEINPEVSNPHGGVAGRTTAAGAAYLTAHGVIPAGTLAVEVTSADAPATAPVVSKFEIEDGFVAPEAAKRGGAPTIYPFEVLNIGQAFFLPNEPGRKAGEVKDYNSTVSSANARLSPKRFRLVEAVKTIDGKEVKGVRIGRVADLTPAEVEAAKVASASRAASRAKTLADKAAKEAADKAIAEAAARAAAAHGHAPPTGTAAPWGTPPQG